jgi:hypothetical protein
VGILAGKRFYYLGATMSIRKLVILGSVAGLFSIAVFSSPSQAAGSCSTYGNKTYCSDGSSSTKYGNKTYNSDGSSSSKYGNKTYNSDGSSSSKYGNKTYNSDGSSSSTYGNKTYCSGSKCSTKKKSYP